MKKKDTIISIILGLLVGMGLAFITWWVVQQQDRPPFIQDKIERLWAIEEIKIYEEKNQIFTWARIFGWGNGIYIKDSKEIPFLWFSWSNEEGYHQFLLNIEITSEDIQQIKKVKEFNYSQGNMDSYTWDVLASQNETWIGTSPIWTEKRQEERYNVLDEKLEELKRLPFFKNMTISK